MVVKEVECGVGAREWSIWASGKGGRELNGGDEQGSKRHLQLVVFATAGHKLSSRAANNKAVPVKLKIRGNFRRGQKQEDGYALGAIVRLALALTDTFGGRPSKAD
jgi:hypothetical protein